MARVKNDAKVFEAAYWAVVEGEMTLTEAAQSLSITPGSFSVRASQWRKRIKNDHGIELPRLGQNEGVKVDFEGIAQRAAAKLGVTFTPPAVESELSDGESVNSEAETILSETASA
jgi:hypothetical protein